MLLRNRGVVADLRAVLIDMGCNELIPSTVAIVESAQQLPLLSNWISPPRLVIALERN